VRQVFVTVVSTEAAIAKRCINSGFQASFGAAWA
jgi:hypothetical protein